MTQRYSGCNLVDVLSARTGRPRKSFLQIGFLNPDLHHSDADRWIGHHPLLHLKPVQHSPGRVEERATSKLIHSKIYRRVRYILD